MAGLVYKCVSPSGGGVPVFDEVIVSLSLMDKVISVDETAGTTHLFKCDSTALIMATQCSL